jgi:hypothetical protein
MDENETVRSDLLATLRRLGATILAFESIKMNHRPEEHPSKPQPKDQLWQSAIHDANRPQSPDRLEAKGTSARRAP